ncbi:hypothetical protein PO909_021038 [Leuciscus waleckii]
MSRLRRFASTGVWPSEAGNRPGPRQKKWFDLFQGIDKCPMQVRRQATLFGGPQECLCGFHPPIQPATSASPVARPPSAARPPSTIPSPAVRPPSVARPPSTSQKPPEPIDVPTSKWLLSVYGRDIISRINHNKASITSTFGTILKMDSTKQAKREQLQEEGVPVITDNLVDQRNTKKELALYCRRRTRGVESTTRYLDRLLQELMGDKGRDMMGVPLLDTGTSANTLNFQLYLLEGLNRWNQDRAAASISTKSSPLLTYAGQVVQSINTNSLNVFGEKLVPTFQPPAQYTDNEQTDQLLEEVNVDEQDEGFEEDINEDPTVSFLLEDVANCNPPTVQTVHPSSQSAAASSQTAAPSSQSAAPSSQSAAPSSQSAAASSQSAAASSLSTAPSSQSAAPSSQSAAPSSLFAAASSQFAFSQSAAPSSQSAFSQAVDDQNIPGMDRVDRLAEYLVELRTSTGLTLSRQQVDDIVCLWQSLLEYDKQRVKFAARHQDRLTTGRFRSPKKKAVFTPGVDSLKRSVLASTASPAQWPDCCRLVEAIFIRLCRIHPSPRKKEKVTLSRWSLVLHDYRKIRQLILSNGAIMQDTTLQLVEVNQTTLVQWHNGRVKKQDQTLLLQGIDLPDPLGVAAQALPPARVLAVAPPQVQGEQHIYKLPQSTAGQAKLKRRITGNTTEAVIPKLATLRPIIPLPVGNLQPQLPEPVLPSPSPTVPLASHTTPTLTLFVVPQSPLPIAPATPSFVLPPPATVSQSQPTVPRPYHRKVEANTCRKCGQFRTAATGHSQFRGSIYCPVTETLIKEQWLEKVKKKK